LKEFLKQERNWLILLGLLFGFLALPKWVTVSRAELLIILFATWTIRQIGEIKRKLDDLYWAATLSNPGPEHSAKPEKVKHPLPKTAAKEGITGGLIGAIIVGLIAAGIGFLIGGLSGAIICGIIGAAIGDQIQRNERRSSR